MAKMVGASAPVSGYIGKSANKNNNSGKSPFLMAASKTTSSNLSGGGTTKPSTTKHGSGFIARAKTAL